jgi:hypothetical protein
MTPGWLMVDALLALAVLGGLRWWERRAERRECEKFAARYGTGRFARAREVENEEL